MTRKILFGSLALAPIALIAHYVFHVSETMTFVLAALALMPLAWLIGEATEHVAEHTGPGIGGFFNASFGNAPELIIALLAVYNGLPDVVRGSIIGSVVSNLLLVLGLTMMVGVEGKVDRRSLFLQLAIVGVGVRGVLHPAVPGWDGDPERHNLYLVTIPIAVLLLALYLGVTIYNLRRHHAEHVTAECGARLRGACARRSSCSGSRPSRPRSSRRCSSARWRRSATPLGLSDFFVAIVIVAIVGNAAEHGGAIVVARRGKIEARDRDRGLVGSSGRGVRRTGGRIALGARRHRAAARRSGRWSC